jgi:hypothetical protein
MDDERSDLVDILLMEHLGFWDPMLELDSAEFADSVVWGPMLLRWCGHACFPFWGMDSPERSDARSAARERT